MTLESLPLRGLLALAPVLTVAVLLVGFRLPASRAMPIAYAVTLAIAAASGRSARSGWRPCAGAWV